MVFHLLSHECQVEEGNDVLWVFLYETLLHTVQKVVFFAVAYNAGSFVLWLLVSAKNVWRVCFCSFFLECCLDSFTFYFSIPKHRA